MAFWRLHRPRMTGGFDAAFAQLTSLVDCSALRFQIDPSSNKSCLDACSLVRLVPCPDCRNQKKKGDWCEFVLKLARRGCRGGAVLPRNCCQTSWCRLVKRGPVLLVAWIMYSQLSSSPLAQDPEALPPTGVPTAAMHPLVALIML